AEEHVLPAACRQLAGAVRVTATSTLAAGVAQRRPRAGSHVAHGVPLPPSGRAYTAPSHEGHAGAAGTRPERDGAAAPGRRSHREPPHVLPCVVRAGQPPLA